MGKVEPLEGWTKISARILDAVPLPPHNMQEHFPAMDMCSNSALTCSEDFPSIIGLEPSWYWMAIGTETAKFLSPWSLETFRRASKGFLSAFRFSFPKCSSGWFCRLCVLARIASSFRWFCCSYFLFHCQIIVLHPRWPVVWLGFGRNNFNRFQSEVPTCGFSLLSLFYL